MEFSSSQLAIINAILPFKYKIEVASKSEVKEVKPAKKKKENEAPVKEEAKVGGKRKLEADPKVKLNENGKRLHSVLMELKNHEKISFFWDFVVKKKFLDYDEKIREPLDLSIIESKLMAGHYQTSYSFALDVRKIWSNNFSYFVGKIEVYASLTDLSMLFEDLIKGLENVPILDKVSEETVAAEKTQKIAKPVKSEVVLKDSERPLSYDEKKKLCDNIRQLGTKSLRGVLEIVKECSCLKGEEYEFDVDILPPKISRKLEKYVNQCLEYALIPKKKIDEKPKYPVDLTAETHNEYLSEIHNDIYIPEENKSSSSTSESLEEIPSRESLDLNDKDDYDLNTEFRW